jgi:predicted transcriptional regulator
MTTIDTAADEAGRRDALADRLFRSMIESAELASVWLGLRLRLYEVLHEHGPATAAELAELGGIDTRYAREWLEQQAVAGLLDVEDAGTGAETRRYRLPDAHADVLLDADHPAHAGATAYWMGSLAEVLQRIPAIYRSGVGLPYPEYGADCRMAIANFNRPMFVNDLADWFAAAPELQARLAADGARVLDAGCGIGWSSISLARAFPALRVDGIDSDEASIAEARRLADEAGVADRVRFRVADAAELGRPARAATTPPSSSRPSTTWPGRSRPWRPSAPCWPTAGSWSWPTRRSPRPSPPPGTRSSGSTTASAGGTACRPAGPRPRRRPTGRPCARTRSATGPARPASPATRCCPSTTSSGASTS